MNKHGALAVLTASMVALSVGTTVALARQNTPAPTPPPPTIAIAPPTTTDPPPTTTQPPLTTTTNPPPSTTKPKPKPKPSRESPPPQKGQGNTAAARFGWGNPLPISDEFNYSGRPDDSKWRNIDGCWEGHAGNGRRCGKNSVVDGSKLVMTGDSNGDTGWLKQRLDARYGRWEARVRSSGSGYHPLLLIWPTSDKRVQDGEYDWLENGEPGELCAEAFLHYPGETPKKQEHARERNCGDPLTKWHNIAFEWTPNHLKGFINGVQWFHFDEADITAMPEGNLVIQLDNFGDGGTAKFEVDWLRTYSVN